MTRVARRKTLVVIAAVFAAPLSCRAQLSKSHRIGWLSAGSPPTSGANLETFKKALNELGYVEGRNLTIEVRWAEGKQERLSTLASELLAWKPDVVVTGSTPAIQAFKDRTATIPIVMTNAGDPVTAGLVASLARPGGNITGLSSALFDWSPKAVELLHAILPRVSRMALFSPATGTTSYLSSVRNAATKFGITVVSVTATLPEEIKRALPPLVKERVGAAVFFPSSVYLFHREKIVALVADAGMPAIYPRREYVEAGGLLSVGSNLLHQARLAAAYVDKILKGAKPGDLPIQQPTEVELVINLKAARALGLTIPESVLLRADEVIR